MFLELIGDSFVVGCMRIYLVLFEEAVRLSKGCCVVRRVGEALGRGLI
jgi:hypothetical protein